MTKSEKRAPPAFQIYASDILANRTFRLATMSARGIYLTMLLELWVNETLPEDDKDLFRILGINDAEGFNDLPKIMGFFAVVNGEIRSPELDQYRARLETRRILLSESGKAGAEKVHGEKRKKQFRKIIAKQQTADDKASPVATPVATPIATLVASPVASPWPLSRAKPSRTGQGSPLEDLSPADAYSRASRGECPQRAGRFPASPKGT